MDATIAYLQSQIQDAPHPPPRNQILHLGDDDDQSWHPSSAHRGNQDQGDQPEAQLLRVCSTGSMKISPGEFICYPAESLAVEGSAAIVAEEGSHRHKFGAVGESQNDDGGLPHQAPASRSDHIHPQHAHAIADVYPAPDLMHHDQHQSCETPVHLGSSPTSRSMFGQPTMSTTTTSSIFHPISSAVVIADDAADFSEQSMVKTISELMMAPLDWSWQHQGVQEQMQFVHPGGYHPGDEERSAAVKKEDPVGRGNVSAASSKTSDGKSNEGNAGNDDNDSGSAGAVISTDDNHNPFSPMSDSSLPDYAS